MREIFDLSRSREWWREWENAMAEVQAVSQLPEKLVFVSKMQQHFIKKKSKLKCVRIACWFCIRRTLSSKKNIYWPVIVFSCQKGDRACSCLQLSIVKNCGLWKRKIAQRTYLSHKSQSDIFCDKCTNRYKDMREIW